jgi:formate hydrogenlyase subunit 4
MYFDLFKLLKKHSVVSETSSWIFRAAPWVVFVTALAACLLVPATTQLGPVSFPGDAIMLFSVLALGRFFMVLSALDTGSTFGGMGGSREAMISSLIEPSILVVMFSVGLYAKSTSIYQMMSAASAGVYPLLQPMLIMAVFALVIVILAETCRIPVDDPATHLELTMVHEAMILEYSGRDLALMEYGAAVKQLTLITLLVNIFMPTDQWLGMAQTVGLALSLLTWLAKVALVSVIIAAIESSTVKFRFFSVPNIAALAFILSFIGFLQFFVLGR